MNSHQLTRDIREVKFRHIANFTGEAKKLILLFFLEICFEQIPSCTVFRAMHFESCHFLIKISA